MQCAITVMGKNTLHRLGKGVEDEDEEDEEHSDKGGSPTSVWGILSHLWKPHLCHSSHK